MCLLGFLRKKRERPVSAATTIFWCHICEDYIPVASDGVPMDQWAKQMNLIVAEHLYFHGHPGYLYQDFHRLYIH